MKNVYLCAYFDLFLDPYSLRKQKLFTKYLKRKRKRFLHDATVEVVHIQPELLVAHIEQVPHTLG